MSSSPALACAAYVRTSTDDNQSPEDSKRWQLDIATRLVTPAGGMIVATYHDIDVTRELTLGPPPGGSPAVGRCGEPRAGVVGGGDRRAAAGLLGRAVPARVPTAHPLRDRAVGTRARRADRSRQRGPRDAHGPLRRALEGRAAAPADPDPQRHARPRRGRPLARRATELRVPARRHRPPRTRSATRPPPGSSSGSSSPTADTAPVVRRIFELFDAGRRLPLDRHHPRTRRPALAPARSARPVTHGRLACGAAQRCGRSSPTRATSATRSPVDNAARTSCSTRPTPPPGPPAASGGSRPTSGSPPTSPPGQRSSTTTSGSGSTLASRTPADRSAAAREPSPACTSSPGCCAARSAAGRCTAPPSRASRTTAATPRPDYADTGHPRTTAIREERILAALDPWLGQLTDPDHRSATIAAVLAADSDRPPSRPRSRLLDEPSGSCPSSSTGSSPPSAPAWTPTLATRRPGRSSTTSPPPRPRSPPGTPSTTDAAPLTAEDIPAALDHAGDLAGLAGRGRARTRARLYRTLDLVLNLDPVGDPPTLNVRLQLCGGGGRI